MEIDDLNNVDMAGAVVNVLVLDVKLVVNMDVDVE